MRRVLAALLLLPVLLVGCQNPGFSREPTPYIVMSAIGGSSFKISGYLKADHQDVKACLDLVERFMHVYLNQDYVNPTLEKEATPLMTTSIIGDPLERYIQAYAEDEVSVELQDLSLGNITFTSGKEGKLGGAVVQVQTTVRYSHASSAWLRAKKAELHSDYRAVFDVQLISEEDVWKVWLITEARAGA